MSEALPISVVDGWHLAYLELVIIERSSLPRLKVGLAGPVPDTRRPDTVHMSYRQTR